MDEKPKADKIPEQLMEAAPKLRAIFQSQRTATAGSLHMVGLELLKEKLGARWPAVAGRVIQLTERLLAQTLGPADAWFRYGDERFVVVFAQLGKTEAALVCAGMVENLQKLLLGDGDTAEIRVHSAVDQVDAHVVFQSNSLKNMLDDAATSATAATNTAAATTVAAQAVPPPAPEAAASRVMPWMGLDALGPAPLQVVFRPVWDRPHQTLSIHLARAMRPRQGRLPLWGYDCAGDESAQKILDLDLDVLCKALGTYMDTFSNQCRCFLAVPVHFESLATLARRLEYVMAVRTIPTEFMRFLYFYVVGLPHGVPSGRASDIIGALKPFCRTVIAMTEFSGHDLPALASAGVKMVHTVLPAGGVERWGTEIFRFAHEAQRLRLSPSMEGLDRISDQAYADAAGIPFQIGDAIGYWSPLPRAIQRMTAAEMAARAKEEAFETARQG
ncbi:GGDEF domain-containing protein [Nitrospirillum iridis]|uniref:GGDEF domain-containing protein n=1 Tax=Nitrospirillum iridis TaxID=765888 RepID=A0A7X0B0R9_9PROT|nr:GGDEF domain-containing protein [Nitrospirillum iridis]MBB6252246.1 GGDEF domain-containing protein [Nitrospirillum iridis]